jgi:WD40 repeat protein
VLSSGDFQAIKISVVSGFGDVISSVALLETKKSLIFAGGSFDKSVKFWEKRLSVDGIEGKKELLDDFGMEVTIMPKHKCKILSVVIHDSQFFGPLIISSSEAPEKCIIVFSIQSQSILNTFSGKFSHTNNISSVACFDYLDIPGGEDIDDDTIVVSGGDKTVRMWSLKYSKLLRVLDGHHTSVIAVGVHCRKHAASIILSGCSDHTIRLWSAEGILLRLLESSLSRFTGTFAFWQEKSVDEISVFSSGSSHGVIVST